MVSYLLRYIARWRNGPPALMIGWSCFQIILSIKGSWDATILIAASWPIIGSVAVDVFRWSERNQWVGFAVLAIGLVWIARTILSPVGFLWPSVSDAEMSPVTTVFRRHVPLIKSSTTQLTKVYGHLRRDITGIESVMNKTQLLLGLSDRRRLRYLCAVYVAKHMPSVTQKLRRHHDLLKPAADAFFQANNKIVDEYPEDEEVTDAMWAVLWGTQARGLYADGMNAALLPLRDGLQQLYDSRRLGTLDNPVRELLEVIGELTISVAQISEARVITNGLFRRGFHNDDSD